jgi:putative endonuclease
MSGGLGLDSIKSSRNVPVIPAKAGTQAEAGDWSGNLAFFTYIVASKPYGTLYTGSTDDIWRRVAEHKAMDIPGFTRKYGVIRLVWVEQHESRDEAFRRERRIKEWRRTWKIRLIEATNPDWSDMIEHLDESFSF